MFLERAEQARKRAYIYSWLCDRFDLPEEEVLKEDDFSLLREVWESLGLSNSDRDIEMLEGFLAQKPALQPVTIEYCKLFYGPNPLEAPPFESVYRDGYRLMGDSTMEVIRKYRQEGLEVLETAKTMPDHAVVEMEFMSYLCTREAEAWDSGQAEQALQYLEKQQAFLTDHLSRWIPSFCARVIDVTRSDFYRSVAGIAANFVRQDTGWVIAACRRGGAGSLN